MSRDLWDTAPDQAASALAERGGITSDLAARSTKLVDLLFRQHPPRLTMELHQDPPVHVRLHSITVDNVRSRR